MKVKERAVYEAGPYKGYHGRAEYDADAEVFHGRLAGTRDVITFEGRTVAETRKAFKESVDDYLAWCEKRGTPADKPYSGRLLVRMNPEMHKRLESLAKSEGLSINALILKSLGMSAPEGSGDPPPQKLSGPKRGGTNRRKKA